MKYKVGQLVKISEGSGYYSDKEGHIISWKDIPFRYDGVPALLGYYNVPDRKKESPIKLCTTGEILLMFNSRLKLVYPK